MFARFTLRRLAPIVAGELVREDAEAGRELIAYELSHRGKVQMALAKAAASQAAVSGKANPSQGQTDTGALQGRMVKREIEDVQFTDMEFMMVSCDICQTSIGNVHRCVELLSCVLEHAAPISEAGNTSHMRS